MTSYSHVIASVFVFLTVCVGQEGQGADAWIRLGQIDNVLRAAHAASGSLTYQGSCGRTVPEAPPIRVLSDYSRPPIEILQKMFAYVPHMRVTEEPGGMVRMVQTDVPRDLLDVKISHLSFYLAFRRARRPVQRLSGLEVALHSPGQTLDGPNGWLYDDYLPEETLGGPNMALELILSAPEVIAFKMAKNIRPFSDRGFLLPGNSRVRAAECPGVGQCNCLTGARLRVGDISWVLGL